MNKVKKANIVKTFLLLPYFIKNLDSPASSQTYFCQNFQNWCLSSSPAYCSNFKSFDPTACLVLKVKEI